MLKRTLYTITAGLVGTIITVLFIILGPILTESAMAFTFFMLIIFSTMFALPLYIVITDWLLDKIRNKIERK